MKPIDMIWAATKAHALWPRADLRGNEVGNLQAAVDDEYVGWIDCLDGSVNDVVTGERYGQPND